MEKKSHSLSERASEKERCWLIPALFQEHKFTNIYSFSGYGKTVFVKIGDNNILCPLLSIFVEVYFGKRVKHGKIKNSL